MIDTLKYIFTRASLKEKGYFFTLQRITQLTSKTYYITNCTKGFLGMVVRSSYDSSINGNNVTIKGMNNNIITITMEELENELVRLIKK